MFVFILLFSSIAQAKSIKIFVRVGENTDLKELERLGAVIEEKFEISEEILVSIEEGKIDELKNLGFKTFEDAPVHILLSDSVPMIKADKVWEYGYTGKGVKVCILDTGIDYNHPALRGKVVVQIDFVNRDKNAFDDNGHGTHVAGIIASNDEKYRGVAPNVSLYIAKVLGKYGSGYTSWVIRGLQWCVKQKVNVISMSLGGGLYKTTCDEDILARAVNRIVKHFNIPIVVAAGNAGNAGMSSPACASKAIAVGAIDKGKNLASFSSIGNEIDLVAPGVNIFSTVPINNCMFCSPTGFSALSGTSMATPHVTGVIALILENNPYLKAETIKKILYSSANKSINCNISCTQNQVGNGLVDALTSFLKSGNGFLSLDTFSPGPKPLLKVEQKVEKETMKVNKVNRFIFKIRNVGYDDAYHVKLEMDINENFKFFLPRQCQISSENKIECNLNTLKVDEVSRIKINLRGLKEGEHQFMLTIRYFDSQGNEFSEIGKIVINVKS